MKYLLTFIVFLAFGAIAARPQTPTAPAKSAKAMVEEYWKMETGGGRLTPEGWYKAATFYVHPIPPPRNKVIFVIHDDFSVWDPFMKGNTAEVMVGVGSAGQIDSSLHYTPPDTRFAKEGVMYNLVPTDKHWEFEPDGRTLKEVTGPLEWRCKDTPGAAIYLTVESAIRYVKKVRDKSSDPTIKKNADKTLAILKRYHH